MKTFRNIIGLLLIVILSMGGFTNISGTEISSEECDWPMYGMNPGRTSYSDCGPNTSQLDTLWKTNIRTVGFSSPIVADGKVFISSIKFDTTRTGYAYCFNSSNGEVIWKDRMFTGNGSSSSPVYYDGHVLFLSSPDIEDNSRSNQEDCYAICYDAENGDIEWKFNAKAPFMLSSPLVDNEGYVYFNDMAGSFYCYSMKNGKKRWKVQKQSSGSTMVMGDGRLYFVGADGALQSISTKTGKKVWANSKPISDDTFGSNPMYKDGVVYVGSNNNLMYAFDAKNGIQLWSFETIAGVWGKPSIFDGKLYFNTGTFEDSDSFSIFNNHKLYCLDSKDGKELWSKDSSYSIMSPAISDNFVFEVNTDGFNIYDRVTGDHMWSPSYGGSFISSPALADNRVYVATLEGDVICYGVPNIIPSVVDFGSVKPGDEVSEKFTITNQEEKKATYKISTDKQWIKVGKESVVINPKQSKEITITVDFDRVPTNKKFNNGKIKVTWGKNNSKVIEVYIYIKRPGSGDEDDFSSCSGWNETGADNFNSNSVPPECSPISPVLELDWKKEFKIKSDYKSLDYFSDLYCYDENIVTLGTEIYCYDIKDGSRKWNTHDQILGFFGGAVHHNGNLWYGYMKGIKSINTDTGGTTFDKVINSSDFNFKTLMFNPDPTYYDGSIYFAYENSIYSLNTKTKQLKKIYTDEDSFVIYAHPIVTDKHIIFENDGIIALNRKTGKNDWSYPITDDYWIGNMAVSENRLFVNKYPSEKDDAKLENTNRTSTILCLDTSTGEENWNKKIGELILGEFAVSKEHLYFTADSGRVYCMPVEGQKFSWKKKLDFPSHYSPILCGDGLFISAMDNKTENSHVYRLDADSGSITWDYKLKGYDTAGPVVSNGRLIVITTQDIDDEDQPDKKTLYCFQGVPLADPTFVEANPSEILIEIDDTLILGATVKDENGYKMPNPELLFVSDDEKICTVDETGKITAVGVGECEITVRCAGAKDTVTVNVVEKIDPTFDEKIDFGVIDSTELRANELLITNRSSRKLSVKISSDVTWLELDHKKFDLIPKGSGLLVLSLKETELPLGMELETTITLDWGYGTAEIPVRVIIKGPKISPNEIELDEIELDEIVKKELVLNNGASTFVDIKVSTDSDWLTVETEEFTLKKKGTERFEIAINTEGLQLGKHYSGKIKLEWRKGGTLEIPVSFSTPSDDVPPVITITEVEEQVSATECVVSVETDEPCTVTIAGVEAILNEEETHYTATVPLDPAPSVTTIEIIATDLAENETKETIQITNIDELVVTMQIGSDVMTVGGEEKPINPAPTVISGSTMVPVRAVSEAFGAEVEWFGETKTVIITLGETNIILTVGSSVAIVGSETHTVNPPPQIISGSTMLPFRFIAEALGATVDWDGETKTITMTLLTHPS